MKKIVLLILFFAATFLLSKSYAAEPTNSSIKFGTFNPDVQIVNPSFPPGQLPTQPPPAELTPKPKAPHEEPIFIKCSAGGGGLVETALFLFYKKAGMPTDEAIKKAREKSASVFQAAIAVFGEHQPCLGDIAKSATRVAIKRGVDPILLIQSFAQMSSGDIINILKKEVSTPLYLWSPQPVSVTIKPHRALVETSLPLVNGLWHVDVNHQSTTISYALESQLLSAIPQPLQIVGKNHLKNALIALLDRANLPFEYRESALASWLHKIPDASSYSIGLYSQKEAETLLPLSFSPKPNTLARLVLYVKPFVSEKKENGTMLLDPLPDRQGLTALDVGIVVDW